MTLKSDASIRLSSALLTLILGGLQTVMPLSTDLYLPALPTIARDLNVSPGAAQFTLAVFMIGVAIGQVVYGPITDKFGRKKPLLVGLAVYILGALVCALAPTIDTLMSGRFLQALGASAGSVIAIAALAFSTVRERMGSAAALQGALQSVFGEVAGGLVGALGNGTPLPVLGIITGFAALAAVFLRAAHRRQPEAYSMPRTPLPDPGTEPR